MKRERGIGFTTEMVKAERADRKTETRRLTGLKGVNEAPDNWVFSHFRKTARDQMEAVFQHRTDPRGVCIVRSPYGQPGDLLYVKESLWIDNNYQPGLNWGTTFKHYTADEADAYVEHSIKSDMVQLVPGRFMYKEMARTWLEVVSISIQRLQDITDAEAVAEGILQVNVSPDVQPEYKDYSTKKPLQRIGDKKEWGLSPVGSYLTLFRKINPKAPPNPWVWVVKFKRTRHA